MKGTNETTPRKKTGHERFRDLFSRTTRAPPPSTTTPPQAPPPHHASPPPPPPPPSTAKLATPVKGRDATKPQTTVSKTGRAVQSMPRTASKTASTSKTAATTQSSRATHSHNSVVKAKDIRKQLAAASRSKQTTAAAHPAVSKRTTSKGGAKPPTTTPPPKEKREKEKEKRTPSPDSKSREKRATPAAKPGPEIHEITRMQPLTVFENDTGAAGIPGIPTDVHLAAARMREHKMQWKKESEREKREPAKIPSAPKEGSVTVFENDSCETPAEVKEPLPKLQWVPGAEPPPKPPRASAPRAPRATPAKATVTSSSSGEREPQPAATSPVQRPIKMEVTGGGTTPPPPQPAADDSTKTVPSTKPVVSEPEVVASCYINPTFNVGESAPAAPPKPADNYFELPPPKDEQKKE